MFLNEYAEKKCNIEFNSKTDIKDREIVKKSLQKDLEKLFIEKYKDGILCVSKNLEGHKFSNNIEKLLDIKNLEDYDILNIIKKLSYSICKVVDEKSRLVTSSNL